MNVKNMKVKKAMKKVSLNFIYNSFYQILLILFPLVTTPYLSRILGSEGIGHYSYSYSVAYYFVMFITLGLNNYGNRTIAAIRHDKLNLSKNFFSIFYMQLFFGIVVSTIYLVLCILLYKNIYSYIFILYVLSAILDINWFFFGLEEFKLTVSRNIIVKIISIICIFIFVKDSNDVWLYCLIMSGSFFLSNILLWPFLKKYVFFVPVTIHDIIKHVKPNLILFIPVIAISMYKMMDKIMLGNLSTITEVGFYENAEKVINIPLALINSLGTVMLPRMSHIMSNDNQNSQIKKVLWFSLLFAVFITVPISLGIIGVSNEFVPVFYGPGYEKCISLFTILLPSSIFVAIANVIRTQILIPLKKDNIYIISVCLGAITNLLINYVLIPKYGSVGAAIGTFFAELVVCGYQFLKIKKMYSIFKAIPYMLPFIIFGCNMLYILNILNLSFSPVIIIFIKIIIGAIIYLIPSLIYYLILCKKS